MIKGILTQSLTNFTNHSHLLTIMLFLNLISDSIIKLIIVFTRDNFDCASSKNELISSLLANIIIFTAILTFYYTLEFLKQKKLIFHREKYEIILFLINTALIIIYIEIKILLSDCADFQLNIYDGFKIIYIEAVFFNKFSILFTKYISLIFVMIYLNSRLISLPYYEIIISIVFCFLWVIYLILSYNNQRKVRYKFKTPLNAVKQTKKIKNSSLINSENNSLFLNFSGFNIWNNVNESIIFFDSKEVLFTNSYFQNLFDIDEKSTKIFFTILDLEIKILSHETIMDDGIEINKYDAKKYNLFEYVNGLIDEKCTLNMSTKSKNKLIKVEILNENNLKRFLRKKISFPSLNYTISIIQLCSDQNKICLIIDRKQEDFDKIESLSLELESQSKMLSHVSHEMRTPLNCIIGMLQSLEESLEPGFNEYLIEPALSSGKYLLNILNDILDMSQIKAGKFKLIDVDFNINLLFKDVVSLFQIQSKHKQIKLDFNIAKNVSNIISTDPNRLKQVLINLVGNAFKYTNTGSITINCKNYKNFNSILIISVIDTGLGIKEEDKSNLLKAFGKVDNQENNKINPQGVGLGLIISDSIIKSLIINTSISEKEKGLQFFSEYGKGSTFYFICESKKLFQNKNSEDYIDESENAESILQNFNNQLSNPVKFIPQIRSPSLIIANDEVISSGEKSILNRLSTKMNAFSNFTIERKSVPINNIQMINNKLPSGNIYAFPVHSQYDLEYKKNTLNSILHRASVISDMSISFMSKPSSNAIKAEEINEKINKLPKMFKEKKCDCPDVLIVDDQVYNIIALKFLLESFHLIVQTANSGYEALDKINYLCLNKDLCCHSFKLIFLDIEMPEMNGFETCGEIKKILKSYEKNNECKVIACTGHNEEDYIHKFYSNGFDNHIIKPVMKGCLAALLISYFGDEMKK